MSAPNLTGSTTVTNCSCSTYDRTLLINVVRGADRGTKREDGLLVSCRGCPTNRPVFEPFIPPGPVLHLRSGSRLPFAGRSARRPTFARSSGAGMREVDREI